MNDRKRLMLNNNIAAFERVLGTLDHELQPYDRHAIAESNLLQEGIVFINFELGVGILNTLYAEYRHLFRPFAEETGRLYRLWEAGASPRDTMELDPVVSMTATLILLELHTRTLRESMTETLITQVCREFIERVTLPPMVRAATGKAVRDHIALHSYHGDYIARTTRILNYRVC